MGKLTKAEIKARTAALRGVRQLKGTWSTKVRQHEPAAGDDPRGVTLRHESTYAAVLNLTRRSEFRWVGTAKVSYSSTTTETQKGFGCILRQADTASGTVKAVLTYDQWTGWLKLEIADTKGRSSSEWVDGTDDDGPCWSRDEGPFKVSFTYRDPEELAKLSTVAKTGTISGSRRDGYLTESWKLTANGQAPPLTIRTLDLREQRAVDDRRPKLAFLSPRTSSSGDGTLPVAGRLTITGDDIDTVEEVRLDLTVGAKVVASAPLVSAAARALQRPLRDGQVTSGPQPTTLFRFDLADLSAIVHRNPGWKVTARVCARTASGREVTAPWGDVAVLVNLEHALAQLEGVSRELGSSLLRAGQVRAWYAGQVRRISDQVLAEVRSGKKTPADAYRFAAGARNEAMLIARQAGGIVERAWASSWKESGKTIPELVDETAKKKFLGRPFSDLTRLEREQVFLEIVNKSGRSRASVNKLVPAFRATGAAFLAVTVGVCAFEIMCAENKLRAGLDQTIIFGTAAVGARVLPAVVGLVCGPPGPVVTTALFVVGAGSGAWLGSTSVEQDQARRELKAWFND